MSSQPPPFPPSPPDQGAPNQNWNQPPSGQQPYGQQPYGQPPYGQAGFNPQGQPPLPPGKKSNVLLWVIGIIVALMIGVTAMCGLGGYFLMRKAKDAGFDADLMKKNPGYATAKMLVTMAPNVETVSSDDDKGIVTVRNKEDGKVMTFKFDPEKKTMVVMDENGKEATVKITGEGDKGAIEINSADGQFKVGAGTGTQIPAWVPSYPGSSPAGTFSSSTKDGKGDGFSFKTSDGPAKVLNFYQEQLKANGFTMNLASSGEQGGLVMAENKAASHTLTVTVTPDAGGSNVVLMAVSK